jgi:site-specific DNA-methyltransferase (adenine-specific)
MASPGGVDLKKYSIIYADPPWHFGGGGVFQDGGRNIRKTADQYMLTKTEDLKKLPVSGLSADNALMFMWTTDQHLPDALELFKAWGFKYSTVAFYWVKRYDSGALCSNVGCWTMKNCEMVLLGTKGKPLQFKKVRNVKQLVEAVRKKHSQKPEEVRKRIELLCGDLPRIELFARNKSEGWDVWGNEVDSDIDLAI